MHERWLQFPPVGTTKQNKVVVRGDEKAESSKPFLSLSCFHVLAKNLLLCNLQQDWLIPISNGWNQVVCKYCRSQMPLIVES
jgi:hypothetical protein